MTATRDDVRAKVEALKAERAEAEAKSVVETAPPTLMAPIDTSAAHAGSLAALLDEVGRFVRRYVVLTFEQATAITLWVAHTHAIRAADTTPYIQVTSATKQAGKTRLLEVLQSIVANPWLTARISAAALVRKVDAAAPTLLLDESDAAFRGEKEYAEALRGILNSGYKSNGKASLCVGKGAAFDVKDFSTFCPKAIAGIGTLPDTIADRTIPIVLRRRLVTEPVARWRERDGRAHAAPLYRALGRWAGGVVEVLRAARPEIPDELSDRAQDVWEPLLAIADWAGGDWPVRARRAAVALMGSIEDTDITVELLRDVQHILTDITEPVVKTEALITALVALDDRPWATWRKGEKPITPHGLARLLKPLGVHPDRHFRTVRGYRVDAFGDAIARYVSVRTSQCHVANETGLGSRDGCDPASPPENATVTQVPPANIEDVTIRRFDSGSDAGPVIDVVPEGADDDDAIRY